MKSFKVIFVSILLAVSFSFSQSAIDTTWHGDIDIMSTKLGIIVKFRSEGGLSKGTIDIPTQKAEGLSLTGVVFNNPKVRFELEAGPGLAVFEGIYYPDSISGTFQQGGISGTFLLKKGEPVVEIIDESSLPYAQEEVSFTNGGNSFTGTFTYPKENKSGIPGYPAVILITGSGPQERDEEIAGFKIFKTIADHLSRNGIAVLRYDDRGTGGSTGNVNDATTMDFAGDVIAAVNYLKSRGDVYSIGLLGHSEGGIVAPIAAVKSHDVQFIILMAGTGVKGIDILKEQSKLIMKADKATKQEIDGYLKLLDAIDDAVKNNRSLDAVKNEIKNSIIDNFDDLPKEQRKNIKNPEQYANDVAEMTIAQFSAPWMKYFMQYDPAPMLEKVSCPVYVLFGGKDLQVPPKQNEKPILDALKKGGNEEVSVEVFPTANHLFQDAVTGSPSEYGQLKKEFVPGFLDKITEWIQVKVQ
jgi:pimeloyl-ACP methyl ester carboxylesterase